MKNSEKLNLLWDRFVMREDVYALQTEHPVRGWGYTPQRNEGGADLPLTMDVLVEHLKGTHTVGVYNLGPNSMVKWGCLDIDISKGSQAQDEEVRTHTLSIAKVAAKILGRGRFLVEWSGRRGYHLWVFFSEPVSARTAQALMQSIESEVPPPEGLHVEIFPKQKTVTQLGSLVKIPLGVHRMTEQRSVFVNGRFEPHEDQWSALQNVVPLSVTEVNELTKHIYIAPLTETRVRGRMGLPCMTRMMEEGLSEGNRDDGMFTLACYLRNNDFPIAVARAVFETVNEINDPPLDTDTLELKLESGYSKTYSPYPCSKPNLDQYCSSSCPVFEKKVADRWLRYGHAANTAIGKISRD